MASPIHNIFIKNNQVKNTADFIPSNAADIVIYEVVRLIDGKILFLEDHVDRFYKSFIYSNLKSEYLKEDLINQLGLLIQGNQILSGNIRFEVVVNNLTKKQEFLAYYIPHSYPSEEQYKNGVATVVIEALRSNPNAKRQHTELGETVQQIISKEKVYEVILIHPDDYVTEGSRSNLFMLKNNKVYTSNEKDILPGITRKYILQICSDLHIDLIEKRISQNELFTMNAIFITGTSPKVLPVRTVSNKPFDVNYPLLRLIMRKFDLLLMKHLANNPKFLKD